MCLPILSILPILIAKVTEIQEWKVVPAACSWLLARLAHHLAHTEPSPRLFFTVEQPFCNRTFWLFSCQRFSICSQNLYHGDHHQYMIRAVV